MQLRRIRIQNFKSVRAEIVLSDLRSLVALIGPNNEGKSSILQILELSKAASGNISSQLIGSISELIPDKDFGNEIGIGFDLALSEDDATYLDLPNSTAETIRVRYEFRLGGQLEGAPEGHLYPVGIWIFSDTGEPVTIAEYQAKSAGQERLLVFNGTIAEAMAQRPRPPLSGAIKIKNIPGLTTVGAAGDNGFQKVLRLLARWLANIRQVESHRILSPTSAIVTERQPAVSGGNLAGFLHWLQSNELAEFAEFRGTIRSLVPSVREIYTPLQPDGKVGLRVAREEISSTSTAHRIDQVGEGVAELFLLAAQIWLAPAGATLVVEEPERGLHPASQRNLLRLVLSHAEETGKQIIWATHSGVMAPFIDRCSPILIQFDMDGNTIAQTLGDEDRSLVRTALGQSPVDLYGHDVLVLGEGGSEYQALPLLASAVLGEDKAARIAFESYGSHVHSKKELISHLISWLGRAGTRIFVIADDDSDNRQAIEDLVRRFDPGGEFTLDDSYIWFKSGERISAAGTSHPTEFEDNFSDAEIADAVNRVMGGTDFDEADLTRELAEHPDGKTSSMVSRLAAEAYEQAPSKPNLNRELASIARAKILADTTPRGRLEDHYEFEEVLEKIGGLVVE